MTKNRVKIDIVSVLQFYDEGVPGSHHHATAINAVAGEDMGVGLMAHCLRGKSFEVMILDKKVTTGKKKGVWLDKWVRVSKNKETIFFQTEIKNWSAYAIGGKKLSIRASPAELKAHKIERWSKEWDGSTFRKKRAAKVLVPMKPPESNCNVEPLICFWDAMHPKGKRDAIFKVKISDSKSKFPRVWVFSMSAYLRNLIETGTSSIMIEMPDTVQRIKWLNSLFKVI